MMAKLDILDQSLDHPDSWDHRDVPEIGESQ